MTRIAVRCNNAKVRACSAGTPTSAGIQVVAPRTPHQVLLEPSTQITYFTLKVKE